MIKLTATVNNVAVEKQIPTSWDEVNYETYLLIQDAGQDPVKILAAVTGIEEKLLRKARIKNLDKVVSILSFISQDKLKMDIPKQIRGYPVPANLELESVERYADLQLILAQLQDKDVKMSDKLRLFPSICAIYALEEYDDKKADELTKEFFKAPCEEVLAVANFTLMKSSESSLGINLNSLRRNTAWRRLLLALRALRSNLVSIIHYYSWKRKLRSQGMSF